jgi:hypothetical protein
MRPTYIAGALVVLCAAFITWRFLPAWAPDERNALSPSEDRSSVDAVPDAEAMALPPPLVHRVDRGPLH